MTDPVAATVVRTDAKGCLVLLDERMDDIEGDGFQLWCAVRGKIHLRDRTHQKTPVVVGDRVFVRRTAPDRGAVESIDPRTSTLSRPDPRRRKEQVIAANVDRVVIVSSAAEPDFNPGLVDRMLAVAEFSHLEAAIVLNKIDLVEALPSELQVYRDMGYPVLMTSAAVGFGVDEVRELLAGTVSVVAGHSGVGKSSLLNVIQPELGLEVGDVNVRTRRGTHTTTAAVWVPLEDGGAVIDTAGIREFGLYGIPARDVGWLFRDIAAVARDCRYPDCTHTHEPGCAVHDAIEAGTVARFRFTSYLRILETLDDERV